MKHEETASDIVRVPEGTRRFAMGERIKLAGILMLAVAAVGCGGQQDRSTVTEVAAPEPVETTAGPPAPTDEGMLPTPFTADQIRDEWKPGFELTMRRWTAEGESLERWRVVAADQDGVDIEFAAVSCDGEVIEQPVTRHSTWTELRDHASYSASVASRSRDGRITKLGDLEGWLYTVDNTEENTVSDLFFADSLPGAPVQMTVRRGDEKVMVLEQIARRSSAVSSGS